MSLKYCQTTTLLIYHDGQLSSLDVEDVRIRFNMDVKRDYTGRVSTVDPNGFTVECSVLPKSREEESLLGDACIYGKPRIDLFCATSCPNARVRRTRPGAWKVKGGGPSRTYRTKALAGREAQRRGTTTSGKKYPDLYVANVSHLASGRVNLELGGRA